MRILLFSLSYLMVIAESKADIFHYNNVLPGAKAAQFSGAYTALSDDPSGIAYNPAGIAFATENELSGSVQGFYNNTETYKKTIGDQDFTESAGGSFSPFLGSLFNTDKYVKNSVAGFSLYAVDALNKRQNTLIKNQPFGEGLTVNRYYRTVNATAETGIKTGAFAKRWNNFALGISVGLYTVDEVFQSYQSSDISQVKSGQNVRSIALESLFEKLSLTAIEPVLGALYKPSETISLGISVRSPVVVKEELISEFDSTKMVVDDLDNVVAGSDGRVGIIREPGISTSQNQVHTLPFGLRLGVAIKPTPRFAAALDLNHHLKAPATNPVYTRNAVTNFHMGLEYQLLSSVYLRSGFFTNADARPRLEDDKNNQADHIDYRGATFFGEYGQEKSRYGAGIIYQWGTGKGQKIQSGDASPAALQEVVGNRLAIAIAISHILGDDKKQACKKNEKVEKIASPPAEKKAENPEAIRFVVAEFNLQSATLRAKDKARIMRFAKVLLAQRSAWQSLLVSGHGDNRGKVQRTKFFSDTRALKVKALLQKAGIDAALITAEGVGLAHMLEGFASAAPQQRRVEIVVKGTGPTSSLREMLDRALAD